MHEHAFLAALPVAVEPLAVIAIALAAVAALFAFALAAVLARARRAAKPSRGEHETAVLRAAQAVTGELALDSVLAHLVTEIARLVRADAAHCYLLDSQRRVLRCAAVHGLSRELLGFEFPADEGASGRAIAERRALSMPRSAIGDDVAHPAYAEFTQMIVAPVVSADEVRGVLGVGRRGAHPFDDDDVVVAEGFASLAALALRNAEMFEQRTRQARVERGFYRIASVLGERLALEGTIEAAAQAANEALGGTFATVLVPRAGALELAAGEGLTDEVGECLRAGLPTRDSALLRASSESYVLASSKVADDERFDEDWRSVVDSCGAASLLAVPVPNLAPDRNGLIVVFFAEERRFADDDLELARHLAGAASAALERAGRYEQERVARSLAQQLARTGSLLATELEAGAVLDEVVHEAPRLLDASACVIRVLEGDELVVNAAEGEGSEAIVGTRTPATARLSGDVVQSRNPVLVEDAAADERLRAHDPVLQHGYRAYAGVPLAAPERALHGVLAVYDRGPRAWRDDEVEALLALAANASAALSNAELYSRMVEEKERNETILANIADGIVAVDREGKVVLWNRAAETITDVPASEALGRMPAEVLGRPLEAADGDSREHLVPIVRSGHEAWLSVTEAVMHDPLGVVAGRIYAFRDISSDRLVEQMKSEFVSTVSEELRRPLTSIYGFAETLLRQDVLFGDEERQTFLRYISRETERLTMIVDTLLNVAQLDTGDLQVTLAPTDVTSVVPDVVAAVEQTASANGHRFVLDLPEERLAADADAEKLRQVLSILIDNAVKFSPEGGTVTVSARRRGRAVEVSVADEGVGIPETEHARIFRKFYRGDSGGENRGGAGLGLFIARGLVTAMGGRIWLSSHEGRGSRFTFELPLAQRAVPAPR